MIALGQGTEKVEETLSMHFKQVPVLRIDRDTTEKRNALNERLDIINRGDPCILVGTQMLSKGHHFPKVTLVCILDTDQGFFSSDFRAMERMGQTLTQIIGRAGRESKKSDVVLQTELPDHPALDCLVNQGYGQFAQTMLEERRGLNFPPFGFMCLIRADAPLLENSLGFLDAFKAQLEENGSKGLKILGPAPASMQRRAGRHRAQLLLQGENRGVIQNSLNNVIGAASEHPDARKVRWSIDIDPLEM